MAPSARAVHKAEAKYGVTGDYPDLQLHSAAANGNVGLVKYALMHGQPVNSVLNGVLPIHIAASSGNEVVVQMLIDAGADANAARLPRKYNADRSKATSSIGAAGSTPLHFAAANGHAHIVSLLLSHGANCELTEKHGLTPEDLAREAGHVNVLTVFRIWRQKEASNMGPPIARDRNNSQYLLGSDLARQSGPSSGSGSASTSGGRSYNVNHDNCPVAPSSASIHSVASSTGRRLLGKPSLDSISSRGKKLAKAASNPNLAALLPHSSSSTSSNLHSAHGQPHHPASTFAQVPVALRQNPSKSFANFVQNSNAPLIHHVINMDKSRRPSLPSVFEKAAHPSQSIKTALGLTPHNNGLLGNRNASTSGNRDNDPYHLGRPHRTSSKTSLAGMFRHHGHNKDKNPDSFSQPLSPAASTFFTGDDELEQAEREAFLRTDRDASSGDEYGLYSSTPQAGITRPGSQNNRRPSVEGFSSVRSRAGSHSSAATSQSNISYGARNLDRTAYPMTAPPTQTTFTATDLDGTKSPPRPGLSLHSSASSVVIPQAIPAPPSSSTQPFFSKAAISAAHNNPPIARPGFYRPRKSSQLSTTASTVAKPMSPFLHESEGRSGSQFSESNGGENDVFFGDYQTDSNPVPPTVIVRQPSVRSTMGPSTNSDDSISARLSSTSPTATPRDGSSSATLPADAYVRPAHNTLSATSSPVRHVRNSSDSTALSKQGPSLPDVRESPESHQQAHSATLSAPQVQVQQSSDTDDTRESEDFFPPNGERPFITRSRASSRARLEGLGHSLPYIPHISLTSMSNHHVPPAVPTPQGTQANNSDLDATWKGITRARRSDSTTTDTRTSRSGSVGESGGAQQRFFGFDYSSSPTGSSASFKYHPSTSTTATSLVSSPPGTAVSVGHSTTVTHAQAQSMVKRKEVELLSYDASLSSQSSDSRRPSLSQQLAAYGDSLAIERELLNAERQRRHPHERIALTIPEPPPSAKYSWEILGKETRTAMPVSKGQRARETSEAGPSAQPQQRMWTHRMVSPYEVPLNRPGTQIGGHRHTSSSGANALTSSGKVATKANEGSTVGAPRITASNYVTTGTADTSSAGNASISNVSAPRFGDQSLRSKASSNLSISRSYLAPPQQSTGSDLSVKKSPRLRSMSPGQPSPRSSSEREREKPSTSYHVVAGPGSEANDSANSSLVSEPRSSLRTASGVSAPGLRHRHSRSDPRSASHSPDASHVLEEQTPRPHQLLRLETVSAPRFHIETKAAGEAAPSPTKPKFGSKFGKLFR